MSSFDKSVLFIKDDETKRSSTWAGVVKQRLRKKHEDGLKIHLRRDQETDNQEKNTESLKNMEETIKALKAKEEGHEDRPAQSYHKPHEKDQPHGQHSSGYGDYDQYNDDEMLNAFYRTLKEDEKKQQD